MRILTAISGFIQQAIKGRSHRVSLRETVTSKIVEAGGRLIVKSALNPMLWLCAIIPAPSLLFAIFLESIRDYLLILAAAPVVAAIAGFLFLLIVDRDKLQSEDYQIRKRSLEMMQQKGEVAVPAINLDVIAEPTQRQIEDR